MKTFINPNGPQKPEILKPSQAEIDNWNATEYSRLRKAEYDKLNQDELRYDDLKNGTTTWEDAIDAIKLKFPKG